MAKKMLIDATHAEETRVVVVDGNKVEEFDFESENKRQLAGNIYLAKVTRVEPSLQAAFVDYGGNRHGFLAFSEIHPDYYQIPVADREALMEEERAYAEAIKARDEEEERKPTRARRGSRGRTRTQAADAAPDDARVTKEVEAEINGMETIDLSADDPSDSDELQAPEGVSPMEQVAETPVAEPVDDADKAGVEQPAEAAIADAQDASPAGSVETPAPDTAETSVDAAAETGDDTAADAAEAVADSGDDAHADDAGEDDAGDDDAGEDDDEDDAGNDAAAKDDSIEFVADEDDIEDIRPPRKPRPRRYKIQEVIKVRQILLVQVVKEERGNKGAALTTYLSLAGRYCVLMPNTARGGGISRKITNAADRKKLKEIASEIDVPGGAGLIVRTAGAKRTKAEIKRDYEYLQRLWEQIRELTLKSIAPAKIYEEGDLIKRSIRDLYNREIDEVFVEGERGYRIAKDFMKMIMPSHAKNVKQYTDPMPLFARYQVESYLGAMFNPTVQLRSGGYIVIGVTEALVAVDVNSGRATKQGSIEETALNTNLEAAEEVARQLRLRDLAGLIVIDFIDMDERKNNTAVEKRLKERLKTDRARIQVGRISGFGLLEMSRQRLRPGMIEATTQPCAVCHGTGLIRSDDNMALSILRQVEEEGVRRRSREVLVKCPVNIANFLMNQKREHVAQIESRYGLSVRIEGDPHLVSPDFAIEKFKTASRRVAVASAPVVSVDTSLMDQIDADESADEPETVNVTVTEAEEAPETVDGAAETRPKRKRRRRRRRGKPGGAAIENGTEDEMASGDADAAVEAAGSEAGGTEPDGTEADAQPSPDGAAAAAPEETTADPQEDEAPAKPRKSRSRSKKAADTKTDDAGPETETKPEDSVEAEAEDAPRKKTAKPTRTRKSRSKSADSPVEPVAESATAETTDQPEPTAEKTALEPAESVAAEAAAGANAEPADTVAAEVVAAPVEPAQAHPEPAMAAAHPTETVTADSTVETADPAMAEEAVPEMADAGAEQATQDVAVEAGTAEPPKPKRRGWWSLGS
ncbi:Rne/Rng family ribonuclease [Sedimentitalea sp. HM32M-2]|uniref:ribonuclease E/G n=1 Tax=Sedimentitalea sp. HM32M-2 TaxID=3351566 RepID=UPI00362BD54B